MMIFSILLPRFKRKLFLSLASKRARVGSGSSLEFLRHRSWTLPVTNLLEVFRQSRFVIVEGVATRLYMPERMTLDLDIAIAESQRDLVYQELESASGIRMGQLSIPGSEWRLTDGTSLDVLEISEPWIEAALDSPNYAPDGLPIIALPYLVLMKLKASRTQDLADVSRMLGGATEDLINLTKSIIIEYLPDAEEDLESLILLGKLEYQ